MLANQGNKLENFLILSDKETAILAELEKQLNLAKTDPTKQIKIERHLAAYPLRLVYALSERSPAVNSLCYNSVLLVDSWNQKLQALNYYPHVITAFNKQKVISPFDTLKGAFLLGELLKRPELNLNDPHALAILNKACGFGLYQALILRLNHFVAKLKESKHNNENMESLELYLENIFKDCEKLSNYYWSPGFLNAALILFEVVSFLFTDSRFKIANERFFMPATTNHFSWLTQYDDKQVPLPVLVLEKAVESLYLAHLLKTFDESKLLNERLNDKKELYAEELIELNNPNDMQRIVLTKLQSLSVPLGESFCDAAHRHALATIKQYTSVTPPELSPNTTPR